MNRYNLSVSALLEEINQLNIKLKDAETGYSDLVKENSELRDKVAMLTEYNSELIKHVKFVAQKSKEVDVTPHLMDIARFSMID